MSTEIGETSAPSVVSGGLWTLLNRVLPQAQLLVLSIIVARYLGPTEMGRQSYIAFVSIALVQAATAGFPIALSRFVGELLGARRGGQALSLYRLTRRVELRRGGALRCSRWSAVALLGGDPRAAWMLAGLSAAFAVLQAVPMALLAGAQRWREGSLPGLVTGVATVPLTVVVLEAGGGITGLFGLEAAAVFANLVWTSALARRLASQLPEPEPAPAELRRRFLSFVGSTSVLVIIQFVVWRRSELFVLGHYSTDAQIAFYSIAFAAISGLVQAARRRSRRWRCRRSRTSSGWASTRASGAASGARCGCWCRSRCRSSRASRSPARRCCGWPTATEYSDAGPVLLAMLAPLLLQPMLRVSEGILYGLGRVKFIVVAGLVATVVDLGLAFALIP